MQIFNLCMLILHLNNAFQKFNSVYVHNSCKYSIHACSFLFKIMFFNDWNVFDLLSSNIWVIYKNKRNIITKHFVNLLKNSRKIHFHQGISTIPIEKLTNEKYFVVLIRTMLAFAMRFYGIFVGTNNTTLETTKFLFFISMFAPDMPVPIIAVGKYIATMLAGLKKFKNKIRKIQKNYYSWINYRHAGSNCCVHKWMSGYEMSNIASTTYVITYYVLKDLIRQNLKFAHNFIHVFGYNMKLFWFFWTYHKKNSNNTQIFELYIILFSYNVWIFSQKNRISFSKISNYSVTSHF